MVRAADSRTGGVRGTMPARARRAMSFRGPTVGVEDAQKSRYNTNR